MEDDPTSQLLHHTYLMTGDPLHRTAFPGDFAEFLSRSPTLSGSNWSTRHPCLSDPSSKLVSSFYRRSDEVWRMTLPTTCIVATLRRSILRREVRFCVRLFVARARACVSLCLWLSLPMCLSLCVSLSVCASLRACVYLYGCGKHSVAHSLPGLEAAVCVCLSMMASEREMARQENL